jgi:ankyrin repeat protein
MRSEAQWTCRSVAGFFFFVTSAGAWNAQALGGEIHDASARGDLRKVKLLVETEPGLVSARDASGQTPLELAVSHDRKRVAEALLLAGADVNVKDNNGWTPLHIAAASGHPDMISLLLAKGADPNVRAKDEAAPLLWAAAKDQKQSADLLLAAGADVNARDGFGQTPLHYAAFKGYSDMVMLLLAKGADVAVRNREGSTALHLAAVSGGKRVVELLLASKCDAAAVDDKGRTAWQLAIAAHQIDVAALLSGPGAAAISYTYSCRWSDGVTPPTLTSRANQKVPSGQDPFARSKTTLMEIEFQTSAPLTPNGAAPFPQILDIRYGDDHYRSDSAGVRATARIDAIDPTTQLPSRWKLDIEAKLPDRDQHSFSLSEEKNARDVIHHGSALLNTVTRRSDTTNQCSWSKRP